MTVRIFFYGGLAVSIAAALLDIGTVRTGSCHRKFAAPIGSLLAGPVRNDMSLTLQYEHPAQRKQLGEKISQARRHSGVNVTAFSVVDPQAFQLDPAAQKARVEMQLQYEYTFPFMADRKIPASTVIADAWQKEQGVWYHVLQTEVIPDKK